MRSAEGGFTLIELLVVIVVIAVLATIAVPSFLGKREKAEDAGAKIAVSTAATAAKSYFVEKGIYGLDRAKLQMIEPSLQGDPGATIAVTSDGKTGYTLTVTSQSENVFTIEEVGGTVARTCAPPGAGGCPAGGSW